MLSLYCTPLTWWHRRSAAAKLCALGSLCVLLSLWPTVLWLATPSSLWVLWSLGPGGREGLRRLWGLWPWWLLVLVLQVWQGQWEQGVIVVLRWGTLFAAATVLTLTTRLDALLALLQRCLPGASGRRLALALALLVRTVPSMLARYHSVALAWRARSAAAPRHRLLAPWLVLSLRDSDQVAQALQARGGSQGLTQSIQRGNDNVGSH